MPACAVQPSDALSNDDDDDDADEDEDDESRTHPINIPPPLKFHPTRARRQFAARLAERQRALQEAQEAEIEHAEDDPSATGPEPLDEHLADTSTGTTMTRLLSGGGGRRRGDSDPRSDDSVEGEDVGIVMRKSARAPPRGLNTSGGVHGAGKKLAIFSPTDELAGAGSGRRLDSSELSEVFDRLGIDVDVEGDIEPDERRAGGR